MEVYSRNGYVICEPYELTNQNQNSLLIQNTNTYNVAKVIDDGRYDSCCEINDIILYNEDNAKEYMLNGKKYIIVNSVDVFAVIREEE